ncbi:MAG: hypothetical protein TRG1_2142 [Flavobacteriaceae bacterium FS1-H7996/R]|nr:MAG: hypothetical protein TRG1_2142 [Flavobacteriaceae bacterium FS1-H7996/R]
MQTRLGFYVTAFLAFVIEFQYTGKTSQNQKKPEASCFRTFF